MNKIEQIRRLAFGAGVQLALVKSIYEEYLDQVDWGEAYFEILGECKEDQLNPLRHQLDTGWEELGKQIITGEKEHLICRQCEEKIKKIDHQVALVEEKLEQTNKMLEGINKITWAKE
jgi:DNA-binding transcriptional MerR regulator